MMAVTGLGSVQITRSDAMLRNAWIAYDSQGQAVAMGMLGSGEIKTGDGVVARITVGRDTWSEIMAATGGAPSTAVDSLDLRRIA